MQGSVVVDSNVFIGLLRRSLDPVTLLGEWIGEGDLATCGMVRLEVERGLRVPKLRQRLSDFFDVMIYCQTSSKVWAKAADLAWKLDRSGVTLPAQDLLIATVALELGAAVLTDDAHFEEIPGLFVLKPSRELPGW